MNVQIVKTIKDILIGQEYMLPRGTSFFAHNAMGYQFNGDSNPHVVRIVNIEHEDDNFTRIDLQFLGSFRGSDYSIMICKDELYDRIHPVCKKKDWYHTMYPERDLYKVFFIVNEKIKTKIETFLKLKEDSHKMVRTMEEEYRKQIDAILESIEDFDQYQKELSNFVNE
jgi:hypothetical protein